MVQLVVYLYASTHGNTPYDPISSLFTPILHHVSLLNSILPNTPHRLPSSTPPQAAPALLEGENLDPLIRSVLSLMGTLSVDQSAQISGTPANFFLHTM
jgi:hypothetical protein